MIGVDYELFWTLNPRSLNPFIKAFTLKQKYDDTISWQNGLYIRLAVASCLSKDNKYPEQPLFEKAEIRKETKSKDMTPEEIKAKMMGTMMQINARLGKET